MSDAVIRLLAPKMEEVLGQKLVIEAKPGAQRCPLQRQRKSNATNTESDGGQM